MHSGLLASLLAAALLATATRAVAQDPSSGMGRLTAGVQLGGSLPTGELGDLYNTGMRGALLIAARIPDRALALRGTLAYDRFGGGTVVPSGAPPLQLEAATMLSVSIAALIGEAGEAVSPYLVAGIGAHRLSGGDEAAPRDPGEEPIPGEPEPVLLESGTRAGATIGGGVRFRLIGLPAHLEVSAVRLFGIDATIVPVVLGIEFGR